MSDPQLRVCLDLHMPKEFAAIAEAKAAAEHAGSGPLSPFEAALVKAKRWRNGRTLHIRFMDGDQALQQRVADCATEWTRHANIQFAFDNAQDAEIRVAFIQGAGSWSAVGTDALVEEWFAKNEPTMNFGWLTTDSTDDDVSSVVLHEFGHALGLIHEHQSPAAEIRWNKELIYRQLGGPPNNWPRETVDHNVFDRIAKTELNFTQYDATSIMHYFFPKEWTLDGTEFRENAVLSPNDIQFISQQYPRQSTASV
jgi:astacin (peptidase family M12A)